MSRLVRVAALIPIILALGACGRSAPAGGAGLRLAAPTRSSVIAVDEAVDSWSRASSVATGRAAAEEARNLLGGDDNPLYGDGDGNGRVAGGTVVGLLPGVDGRPGLASNGPNACVKADLLGGSWEDAPERWAILDRAIAAYRPDNNVFPTLPSHAQRGSAGRPWPWPATISTRSASTQATPPCTPGSSGTRSPTARDRPQM